MSKRPSFTNAEDDRCGNEKHPRRFIMGEVSPKSNENINSLETSAETLLAEAQNQLNLKDQQINDLQEKLNEEQTLHAQTAEIKSKLEAENLELKDRCTSLTKKNEKYIFESGRTEVLLRKRLIVAESDLTKEKDKNKEMEKTLEAGPAKTTKCIEERGVTNEAKKDDRKKRKKESDEKNRHIPKPEEKLNTDKKNTSFSFKCDTSKIIDSKWRELLKSYESIFLSSNSSAVTFLDQVAEKHFSRAEKMQPNSEMQEKMGQIEKIFDHFFSNDTKENRKSQLRNLRSRLNTKRSRERNVEYKKCHSTLSVAYTPRGDTFYYSIKWQNKWNSNGIWKPYSDKECQDPLNFKMPDQSKFGIPHQYSSCKYILIFQSSDANGKKLFKMTPETGCIKDITAQRIKT